MSKTEAAKILLQRDKLTAKYFKLKADLDEVRDQLMRLPLVGRFRPQVILRMCKCGAGPFSGREIRLHKCGGK